ncbi:MAG: MFS transporter [Candidatus Methanofastidiosia archaeon]|jgi:MFS family permease
MSKSGLWVIVTSGKLVVMAGWIVAPVVHILRDALHVNPCYAGLIVTVHTLTAAVCYVVFNKIKISRKLLLICGLFAYGICGGAGFFIELYWVLLVSRILLGVGVAAALVSVNFILKVYETEHVKEMMSPTGSTSGFGSINWPIIAGFFGMLGWHVPFLIYFLGIPLGVCAMIFVPEINIPGNTPPNDKNNKMYTLFFLSNLLLFTVLVFLPQLLDEMGVSFPLIISIFLVGIMISQAITGFKYQKVQKYSRKTTILIGFILWISGILMLSQTHSVIIVAVSVILCGAGNGVIMSLGSVLQKDGSQNKIIIARYTGQGLPPLVFYPVMVYGISNIFLAAGVLCSILFLVVLFDNIFKF